MTNLQRLVRTLLHEEHATGVTTGPARTRASRADALAARLNTSTAAVTRALLVLEAAGLARRVEVPGLTVTGWVLPEGAAA